MFSNALCQGKVWHTRHTPKNHQFNYKLNMWLVDIDDLTTLISGSRLVNYCKRSLYRFKQENYLRDGGGVPLKIKVREKLTELGAKLTGGEKVILLGQLSNLGFYFSPLNLYFVFRDDNCCYVLAEVSNTPWNERHYYLLDKSQPNITTPKKFHVSPFFKLDQEYHWDFRIEQQAIHFRIDSYENEEQVFSAGFGGRIIRMNSPGFNLAVLKAPLNVYKIVAGIYFEALRLWLKRIPFVAHPRLRR